jgi:hypothetical protein
LSAMRTKNATAIDHVERGKCHAKALATVDWPVHDPTAGSDVALEEGALVGGACARRRRELLMRRPSMEVT